MEAGEQNRTLVEDGGSGVKRFLQLGVISVKFKSKHTAHVVSIKVEAEKESYKSDRLDPRTDAEWTCNLYLSTSTSIIITLRDEHRLAIFPKKNRVSVIVDLADVQDGQQLPVKTPNRNISFHLIFRDSLPLKRVVNLLGEGMTSALESKVIFLDKIGKVSIFLQGVIDLGTAISDSHPVAKAAFSIVGLVFQKCRMQQECHKQAIDLLDAVIAKLPFSDIIPENIQSDEVQDALNALLEVIRRVFIFLDKYASAPAHEDFIMSRLGEIVDMKKRLREASDDFTTCVTARQYVMVSAGRDHQHMEALDKLKPVLTAQYNRDQACLQGTREELLEEIKSWSQSLDVLVRLYWLFGLAGSGKSAIATTVCQLLRQSGVLAGSFFCKRDIPEQREAGHILPTLSYGLALVHKPYRQHVLQVLEKEPAIASAEMSLQLRLLFMEPIIRLSRTNHRKGSPPFIFVIDALDECGDLRTRSQIAGHLAQLAGACDWLKIFITSRPLPELHGKLDRPNCTYSKVLDLTSISAEGDIYQYTKHSLEELASSQMMDQKWLADDFIQLLSRKAAGLFIWTSTVMKYVEGQYDQDAAFEVILSGPVDGGPSMGLDSLYLKIIRGSRGGSDATNKSFMRAVLGMIYITAKNKPLSLDALYDFMIMFDDGEKISKTTLRAVMNDLKSVLYEDSSKGNVIRVCHPSFLDFVAGHDRSIEYWTDPEVLDNAMALKCLTTMNKELKFNICQLESSRRSNQDVGDLQSRIERFIPETLQYSCSYWINHIDKPDQGERELMKNILCNLKVLYWIEVLSLIHELQRCIPKLQILLKVYQDDETISTAVSDIYRFMTLFYEPMSVSTPHIYVSALSWLPEESYLAKLLYPFFTNQPVIESGREKRWQSSLWVKNMGNWINQVVFSPDGAKVAAASHDFSICIWDVRTGERTGLIIGHPSTVMCLAWSPDGNHIASGSSTSVLVWDAKNYMLTGEPLEGHHDAVLAVAYSPDGRYIASGAMDRAIFVWNAHGGGQAREPLRGHLDSAKTLSFSPDSKWLASGSDDKTIRIWDIETGEVVRQLEHPNWVNCVIFSRDGTRLASASHDYTICVWDLSTSEMIGEPLRGHLNAVRSISFSPDSKFIASGSDDLTVCVWDVETGLLRGAPFRGHLHWITSVAFSPDGNYIASGANDFTVRLWDVHTNAAVDRSPEDRQGVACKGLDISQDGTRLVSGTEDGAIHIWDRESFTKLKTLEGHTAQVNALKFSLDGKYIVSASNDFTIRVWDAESGEMLATLSPDNCLWVNTIAFIPDGKRFVSGAGDSKIHFWDLETRQAVREPFACHNQSYVNALNYSRDGTLLASGGGDRLINIWNVATMTQVGKTFEGHSETIKAVVFSLDAEKLVSGSNDNSVRIWNVKTSEQIHLIDWHTYWINCISLAPDGKRFVTAVGDTLVRIWDLETGQGVGEILQGHSSWVRNAVYTPDGKFIISASDDSTLRLWDSEASQRNYVPEIDVYLAYISMDDGWIRSNSREPLLWVPPEQRNGIRDVCMRCIPADALGHPVRLDWNKIVNHASWTDILKET